MVDDETRKLQASRLKRLKRLPVAELRIYLKMTRSLTNIDYSLVWMYRLFLMYICSPC